MKKKFTWSGITYEVQIDVSRFDTSRWAQSKRLLFGSLLCLSKDNFETMLFATVADRDPKEMAKGRIHIKFIDKQDVFEIEKRQHQYLMVESPAYFEAHRHVLSGLKELNEDNLPFKKYLVECSADVDPPDYIRRGEEDEPVYYDLSKISTVPYSKNATQVPVLQLDAWPSADALQLNSSQLAALKTAITTEFSVIQGPPGTGKTYVGAKIVQCLLANRDQWDPEENSPMLMVCYTNHALDQFLEKVLQFLPEDEIIRVGGGCKSEALAQCRIFTKRHRWYEEREILEDKILENELEIESFKDSITKANKTLLEFEELEDRMDSRHTDQLYNAVYPPNATIKCQKIHNAFKLWLCDNKELNEMNQHTSKENENVESNEESTFLGKDVHEEDSDFLCDVAVTKFDVNANVCKGAVAPDELSIDGRSKATYVDKGTNGVTTVESEERVIFESGQSQTWKLVNPEVVPDSSSAEQNIPKGVQQTFEGDSEREDFIASVESASERLETNTEDSKADDSNTDQETIMVDEEAIIIQSQRCIEGDEEYMSEIPKQSVEGKSSLKNQVEVIDENDQWTEITYGNQYQQVVWQTKENETSKKESKSHQQHQHEIQRKYAAESVRERSLENKVNLTADTKNVKRLLQNETMMPDDEAVRVANIWFLSAKDRLRLYLYWLQCYRERCREHIRICEQKYEDLCGELQEAREKEEENLIRQTTVVGMTTSGAARYHSMLQRIAPKIVIIEEAAEVMEAHIITSLTRNTKHTILIGDHKQLRPKTTVFKLAREYNLGISLFERMVTNRMDCKRLCIQHRMRPEIASLTKRIYDHEIIDHDFVCNFDDISGVSHNLFFVDHCEPEEKLRGLQSFSNPHEAGFLVALCRYRLLQGYKPEQITVLTMYTGQLLELKNKMPKHTFQGVRVCVVDNFQGEENDIILLSLVRGKSKIGFLEEPNRICVALSRARQGFYCIGNFNLLKSKCKLWEEICDDLDSRNAIGQSLKLVCKRHKNINEVRHPTEFQNFPLGGCDKICGERLDCGHACDRRCHPTDMFHEQGQCPKECRRSCPNEHQCQKRCHYPDKCFCPRLMAQIIANCGHQQTIAYYVDPETYRCPVKCERTLPKCGHQQTMPCYIDPETYCCPVKCERTLACGHECKEVCGKRCTLKCKVACNKPLRCGHEKVLPCFKRPGLFERCDSDCNKVLACGHPCSKKCKDRCQCNTTIEVELTCKHRVRILCREKSCPPTCTEKCSRYLDCGHSCPRLCYEKCNVYQCETLDDKVLPCGHTQRLPCHVDTNIVICEELCQKTCEKGHPCRKRCHFGLSCGDCKVEVNTTIPECKHTIKTFCSVHPAELVCKMPCERERVCGHPCRNICGKRCEARPCMKLVPKTLPCNHTITMACHKNPETYKCKINVAVDLLCGHKKSMECHVAHAGLQNVFCKKRVEKELPCKHKVILPCHAISNDFKCKKKVEVELTCGHKNSVICSAIAQSQPCMVKVKRTLPCKHEAILPCYKKAEEYGCQEEVKVGLPCGHMKRLQCSRSKEELEDETCEALVTKTLPCKHKKEVQCFVNPEGVLCDTPCEKPLSCRHPCHGRCSDDCKSLKCTEEVCKDLPCGHKFSCRCSDDVCKVACPYKCNRKLPCGHMCNRRCSEKCSQYKCKVMVTKKLPCQGNHTRRMPCCMHPRIIVCQKSCKRKLDCGHPCQGLCGEPCGLQKCKRRVEKTFSCGHKATLSCFEGKIAICRAPCQKKERSCKHLCKGLCGEHCSKYPCHVFVSKTLPCGHKTEMSCSDSPEYVQCPSVCGVMLRCGHQCSGTCNDCQQRGSHEMCRRPCNRLLVCLHRCKAACSEPCPPCDKECSRRCPHEKCTKRCSEPCRPCKQPCKWSCPHYQCNNLCGECVSHRCPRDAPCPEKLNCGHPCIGLCGEICPQVCGMCHAKKLASMLGDGPDKQTEATRCLKLFDCGHLVKVEEMDAWMTRELGNDVQLARCIRCITPITFSYRYGDVIKRSIKNIENAQAQIQAYKREVSSSVCRLTTDLTRLNYNVKRLKFPQEVIPTQRLRDPFSSWLDDYRMNGRHCIFIFTLNNHLRILKVVQTALYELIHVQKVQASCKQHLKIDEAANATKDALEKIEEYLQKPQFDLKTLSKVHKHTRKLLLFAYVLEVQSKDVNNQFRLSSTSTTQLKLAHDRFNLFLQGHDDALDLEWLEEVVNSLRTVVNLSPLPTGETEDFANFPGYQRGVWKLCEKGHVHSTRWIVRGGRDVLMECEGCIQCVTEEVCLDE